MGFNVLEWFVQESWKFYLFLDNKTLIAPIKLKLTSLVMNSAYSLISPSVVVQKVRNKTPHMGLNVLELFAQESWKFDLFMDTKTLIVPVKFKSASSVMKFCLLLHISFFDRAKGMK